MGSAQTRVTLRAIAVAALALAVVPVALAVEQPSIRLNAADQAAAKAATLKLSDFTAGYGWKGGAQKPDLTPDESCPTKRSDLVVTGAAMTEFKSMAIQISSETHVLQTSAMVSADWSRTFGSAAYLACGRRVLLKPEPNVRPISFTKLAFPKLTRYVARYRLIADYGTPGSEVRVFLDMIVLARGRTEMTLTVAAPYASRGGIDAAERRLAQILVSRIKA